MGAAKPDPAQLALEQLPIHLLEVISTFIAEAGPQRQSLNNFSLVSRTCHHVAERERFRKLNINLLGPQFISDNVRQHRDILDRQDRLVYVRVLRITCASGVEGPGGQYASFESEQPGYVATPPDLPTIEPAIAPDYDSDSEDDVNRGINRRMIQKMIPPPSNERQKRREDEAWLPLVKLITDTPRLEDIIYRSRIHIPAGVLDAIHEAHPGSRLHIPLFRLSSLNHPKYVPMPMHPAEVALATSPCLYSISMATAPYDAEGHIDYNEEALYQMLRGRAPRLFKVHYEEFPIVISQALAFALTSGPRPRWGGLPTATAEAETPVLPPKMLHLQMGRLSLDHLPKLDALVAFRNLRSLHLRDDISEHMLSELQQIAKRGNLASIRSLHLAIEQDANEYNSDYAVADLITNLTQLENITLVGFVGDQAPRAIIRRHAETIRSLSLLSFQIIAGLCGSMATGGLWPSVEMLKRMAKLLKHLERLTMVIPVQRGSKGEIDRYQALGGFTSLRRLTLLLDCAYPDTDAKGQVNMAPVGHTRTVLKNAALDEKTAGKIFNLIDSQGFLDLIQITPHWGTTEPRDWERRGPPYAAYRWVARQWQRRRVSVDKLVVEELNAGHRKGLLSEIRALRVLPDIRDVVNYERPISEAWDCLWHCKVDPSTDWWDKWSSFPLYNDGQLNGEETKLIKQ